MNILFLCVANSARSQLAEGLARQILGTGANIQSAGSEPSGKVNPFALQVLKELNIDTAPLHSKSIGSFDNAFLDGLDYVVTLCADEVCPVFLSKAKKLHWPHPDPANVLGNDEEKSAAFREARDSIAVMIKETFLTEF